MDELRQEYLVAGKDMKMSARAFVPRLILPLILFLVAYGMQRSVALLGMDLHHDGFMFDAARRTFHGDVPYRDFFYQYNLATIFLHVAALKMLGVYIASLKIATSMVYALIAVLIYACVAHQGRIWQGFLAAILWSTLSPFYMPAVNGYHAWSSVYMMASIMLGIYFLLRSVGQRTLLNACMAGLCFNLAFWFKQIAALQILFCLAWILLNTRPTSGGHAMSRQFRTIFMGFVLGGLISATPFFFYLWQFDSFADWWISAFEFNRLFALTHTTVSTIQTFVGNMFPVGKALGYTSVIWAIVPAYLIATLFFNYEKQANTGNPKGALHINASLLATMGLCGWLEYFPLSHDFHTQLFTAPVFSLIALQPATLKDNSTSGWDCERVSASRRFSVGIVLSITLLIISYDAARHLFGLREKLKQPWQYLLLNSPAKGLALNPYHAKSFDHFHEAIASISSRMEGSPQIPLSVDPLRALFPYVPNHNQLFKMGVDWTWPNETVEPPFNEKLQARLKERQLAIYADSLLAIPGYTAVGLLEVPSAIKAFHTLYVPTADRAPPTPRTSLMDHLEVASPLYTDSTSKASNQLPPPPTKALPSADQQNGTPMTDAVVILRLDSADHIRVDQIKHLHISVLNDASIPKSLTKLEYGWLVMRAATSEVRQVSALYRINRDHYTLVDNIKPDQAIMIGKFFLNNGKLLRNQSLPYFFTTLSASPARQPYLAEVVTNGNPPRLVWGRQMRLTNSANEKVLANALAIPFDRYVRGGSKTIYWQIALNDNTSRSGYFRYVEKR